MFDRFTFTSHHGNTDENISLLTWDIMLNACNAFLVCL